MLNKDNTCYKIGDKSKEIANTQHFLVATIKGMSRYNGVSLLLSCVGQRTQGCTIGFVHIDHNGVKTITSGGIAFYVGTVYPIEVVLTDDGALIYITSVAAWSFATVKVLQSVVSSSSNVITMSSDAVGVSSITPDLTIK